MFYVTLLVEGHQLISISVMSASRPLDGPTHVGSKLSVLGGCSSFNTEPIWFNSVPVRFRRSTTSIIFNGLKLLLFGIDNYYLPVIPRLQRLVLEGRLNCKLVVVLLRLRADYFHNILRLVSSSFLIIHPQVLDASFLKTVEFLCVYLVLLHFLLDLVRLLISYRNGCWVKELKLLDAHRTRDFIVASLPWRR